MEVGSLLCSALLAGRPLAAGGEEEEEKREWNREELTVRMRGDIGEGGHFRHLPVSQLFMFQLVFIGLKFGKFFFSKTKIGAFRGRIDPLRYCQIYAHRKGV